MMTYEETLEYIHSVCWKGSRPGLERTRELLKMMGNPQDRLKYVHVAGTNGKGSVCSMLASVLKAAGYKTGLYTSPFVRYFNERMFEIHSKTLKLYRFHRIEFNYFSSFDVFNNNFSFLCQFQVLFSSIFKFSFLCYKLER